MVSRWCYYSVADFQKFVKLVAVLQIVNLGFNPTHCLVTKEQILSHARFDLFPDESDYIDEVLNGHRIRDADKFKRQEGCLCVKHFIDPHCGSDLKTYDNGCFFLCAQSRNPGLSLHKWGKCEGLSHAHSSIETD